MDTVERTQRNGRQRPPGREATINLKQIKYLAKIVELGNMTAAAQALGIAQPALGAQIRQLEHELNMQLLDRHSRGVSPTHAGILLARRGRLILADIDHLIRDLESLNTSMLDKVTLGVSPTMVLILGDVLLAMAKTEMPNITLSLIEERTPGLVDALERQQADLGFLFDVDHRLGLARDAVLEEDLLLVSAPEAAPPEGPISFADALDHDLVMAGARGILRKIVAAEASRLSLEFKVTYEVHSITAMKAMVVSGQASTIIPYSLAAREIDSGALVARKIARPGLTRILYLVQRRPRPVLAHEAELQSLLKKTLETYLARTHPWTRSL